MIFKDLNEEDMRSCLNEKLGSFVEATRKKYESNCDWNPKLAVEIPEFAIFPEDSPTAFFFMDMWNAAIDDLNLDRTIARFEEENYREMIFIGFRTKAWKFLEKAGLTEDDPHCCPSKWINPEDSDSFYGDESAQSALVLSLQNLINQNTNQAQILDNIDSGDNENTITMDLCLEENDVVTTNIPLKFTNIDKEADVFELRPYLNNSLKIDVDEKYDNLVITLTDVREKWMKTKLKMFLIYLKDRRTDDEIEDSIREGEGALVRAKEVTILAYLTKQDCLAAEEKAEAGIGGRQDLRNVNLPILHSKIFYYDEEIANLTQLEKDRIKTEEKDLMKYFIERVTDGIRDAFNGFKINDIEYAGLRKANPEYIEKPYPSPKSREENKDEDSGSDEGSGSGDLPENEKRPPRERIGQGQISDIVLTLYSDSETTAFKDVFENTIRKLEGWMDEYIKENNISYIRDEDRIKKRMLSLDPSISPRNEEPEKSRSFKAQAIKFTEPESKDTFDGLKDGFLAIFPFLVFIPTMKILATVKTMLNVVISQIEITAYNPKTTRIVEINELGDPVFEFRNTSYGRSKQEIDSFAELVRASFDTAKYKPRSNKCVTSIVENDEKGKTVSLPNPFSTECLNVTESTYYGFSLLGAMTIFSFLLFLRFSWPFIMDFMDRENFIPICCGDRAGNKRTIGTNVNEKDIENTYRIIERLGFFDGLMYQTKPVSRKRAEKNKKNIDQFIVERLRYKEQDKLFWESFKKAGERQETITKAHKWIPCLRRTVPRFKPRPEKEKAEEEEKNKNMIDAAIGTQSRDIKIIELKRFDSENPIAKSQSPTEVIEISGHTQRGVIERATGVPAYNDTLAYIRIVELFIKEGDSGGTSETTFQSREGPTMGEAKEKKPSSFRHLAILLKKSLLIQIRHPWALFFEIFLPVLFGSLLIVARVYGDVTPVANITAWDTFNPRELSPRNVINLCRYDEETNQTIPEMEIAYAPDTLSAKQIMDQVLAEISFVRVNGHPNPNITGLPYDPDYDPGEVIVRPFLMCPETNEFFNFTNATTEDQAAYISTFQRVTWNITAYATEEDLSTFIKTSESTDQIFMAVTFNEDTFNGDTVPDTLDYKIRPPAVPRTEVSSDGFASARGWLTDLLYPQRKRAAGPRSKSDATGGSPYYGAEGLLYLQYLVNNAFSKVKNSAEIGPVEMKRFPYPEYTEDDLMLALQSQLAFVILITTLYLSSGTAKTLVIEKETRLKEYMLMMGLKRNTLWSATWIFSFGKFLITCFTFTFVLFVPFTDNGAVFLTSDGLVFFLFLLSYGTALISLGFFMGALFSTSTSASVATGGVTFLMFIPYRFLQINGSATKYGAKIMASILPPVAMALGLETVGNWEIAGEGATFKNFFTPLSSTNPLNLGTQMCILLFDTLLFFLLGLYVDTIRPGQWGIPKPWNFFCLPSYWRPSKKNQVTAEEAESENPLEQKLPAGTSKESGFRLRNLVKEFEDKGKDKPFRAVDNLSIDAYENEITVLLGPNGAGKSTTINMMSGMLVADTGSCEVGGFNITTNPWAARSSLGLCPQHDILIAELTVNEHLIFFAEIKGFTNAQAQEEAKILVQDIQLGKKQKVYSSKLSGGMKRKLSIGIALCGGSKHLILDEPSSGIDVRARRELWKILEKYRRTHTMLLSTHYMDEAEQLADRIIIMARGSVKCSGTVLFLKEKLGTGYHLTMTMSESTDFPTLDKTIRNVCSGAYVEKIYGQECDFILPFEDVEKFPELFEILEKSSENLGVSSFGVSVTTMNEIFLKMTKTKEDLQAKKSVTSAVDNEEILKSMTEKIDLLTGPALRFQQFRGSFIKCMFHSLRNIKTILTSLFFPAFFVSLAVIIIGVIPTIGEQDPIDLSLTPYEGGIKTPNGFSNVIVSNDGFQTGLDRTFPDGNSDKIANIDEATLSEHYGNFSEWDDHIAEIQRVEKSKFDNEYLMAFHLNSTNKIALFNNEAYHTPGMAMHYMSLILLKQQNENLNINAQNHPLPPDSGTSVSQDTSFAVQGYIVTFYCIIGMMIMYAQFSLLPCKEREQGVKVMQKCSGAPLWVTWLANYCWDILNALLPNVLVVIILLIGAQFLEGLEAFSDAAFALWFGTFITSLAIIPCVYCLSFLFTNPANASNYIGFLNFGLGIITFITYSILSDLDDISEGTINLIDRLFSIAPQYCFARIIFLIYYNGNIYKACEENEITRTACEEAGFVYVKDVLTIEEGGIGEYLAVAIALIILYFVLLSLIEWESGTKTLSRFFKKIIPTDLCKQCCAACCCNQPDATDDPEAEIQFEDDSDVIAMAQKVNKGAKDLTKDHSLVVDSLEKNYDGFRAVKGVSFTVKPNSCFGLLGPNGAGKTSCFKMLTGEETVSKGYAYINGLEIQKDRFGSLREFGYCPQFDALLQQLTGRETLYLYGRLRGVPEKVLPKMVNNLIELVGIKQYAERPSSTYSGGNKRKLSVAIALTGYPRVTIMDEPSCGLDPGARRQLWSVILSVMKTGASVLLTSHSMEETAALCDELAIMVNGRLRCIGGQQHLKSKFGKGVEIEVQLPEGGNSQNVSKEINNRMPFLEVKEINQSFISFRAESGAQLSTLFKELQATKNTGVIAGYTVDQPTLEQIFIDLTGIEEK
ncbi:Oidioi.mRNA.OKI2018_I69.PAR.g12593.t1.cds [Oikopleura dioica]|uniref:Oidioi.mRNA.OKI2018_I69.PAR.g12593.t1.cds n=1 Tax=Oikopleura dioica TaxID=34765 RepID=A0ABN7S187_OIKDI|nr:Oidioi.mRNA.OKI2018_I69.PAR.g12593.t1.cds [Oikopleura dioica]